MFSHRNSSRRSDAAIAQAHRLQPLSIAVRRSRSGLTLLEIVLSLAIFFGAIAALSQLATNGTRATVTARLKTQATIRCQTKLNEVLAGVEPMQSRSDTAFPDDSRWTWSQVVTPSDHRELVQIDLTVSHRGNSRLASVSVSLRRWAREQAGFARGAEQEKQEQEKAEARKQ
jgi:general secretion pathway protein I